MSVWEYSPRHLPDSEFVQSLVLQYCHEYDCDEAGSKYFDNIAYHSAQLCRYCRSQMAVHVESRGTGGGLQIHESRHLFVCARCGWWFYVDIAETDDHHVHGKIWGWTDAEFGSEVYAVRICESSLRELDLARVDQPLADVKSYLTAKAEARFSIHPRLLEEVVGSVFRDAGYHVVVTSYGNDGGIDAILTDSAGAIGVQVKRVRDTIKVAQIRELLGALVLSGQTRGIFVTTSDFQKGAYSLQANARHKGYDLELMNGKRLLEALGVNQRPAFKSVGEFEAEFYGRLHPHVGGNFVVPRIGIG